jgi:hypothetical protein
MLIGPTLISSQCLTFVYVDYIKRIESNKHTRSVRLKKPGPKHDGRNRLRSSMTKREEHFELIPFIT